MERENARNTSAKKEQVILRLLGMEREWVHSGDRGWIDINDLQVNPVNQVEVSTEEPTRKWWQFWKK